MAKPSEVKVPQSDGEIVMSVDGSEAVTYKVTDHVIHVADRDLQNVLRHVEGSKVHAETRRAAKEGDTK